MMDCNEVKTIDDCIECATLDTYDEHEEAAGWQTCLEEVIGENVPVKVLGEDAILEGFKASRGSVVAVCKKGNKKIKVTPDSLELINPSEIQKLWLQAWLKWLN